MNSNIISMDCTAEDKKKKAHALIDTGEYVCMRLIGKTKEQGGGFQLQFVCGDHGGLLLLYWQMLGEVIRQIGGSE